MCNLVLSELEQYKKIPASKLIYIDGIGMGSRIYAKTKYAEIVIEKGFKINIMDISMDTENFYVEGDVRGEFEFVFCRNLTNQMSQSIENKILYMI